MVDKKSIANAIAKFISEDLIKDVDDIQTKFTLCLAKQSLIENPNVIKEFLENPLISTVIYNDDEMYDLKDFSQMLKKVLDEYGSYPIAIPKIPLLISDKKIIRINSCDIDKILSYMTTEKIDEQEIEQTVSDDELLEQSVENWLQKNTHSLIIIKEVIISEFLNLCKNIFLFKILKKTIFQKNPTIFKLFSNCRNPSKKEGILWQMQSQSYQ